MSQEETSSKITLSRDALMHSLAFKGMSLDVFNEAVEEVKTLTADGRTIYPPYDYPSLREPQRASILSTSPDSEFEGRLAPAEAVGVRVLQQEALALMQSFGKSSKLTRKIDEVLGTGTHAWAPDAMEGIVEFMLMIGYAASARERILSEEVESEKKTMKDFVRRNFYKLFKQSLELDNLKISTNTATKIVEEVQRQANEKIPFDPEGAKNEKEIKARIAGRIRGAELAKALYLETVNLAGNTLPMDIELKVVST